MTDSPYDGARAGAAPDDGEVVAGVPVVAGPRRLELTARRPAPLPARQAMVVAASSFLAGAAAMAVAGRRGSRLLRRRRRRRRGTALGEVVGSHSFLVDVHVLRR